MNYFICSLIAFFSGIIITIIFQKYVEIKIKRSPKQVNKKTKNMNPKINCINEMLWEIKKNGNLSINLSGAVLMSLKEISKINNWEEKIDNETMENLYKIYERWQRHLNNKPQKAVKVAAAGGFHKQKYWEGTLTEYKEAVENGLIDDFTDVEILEDDENYHGSYLSIDSDGQIEEYME